MCSRGSLRVGYHESDNSGIMVGMADEDDIRDLYSDDWQVANEVPTIDDRAHRILYGELHLSVSGCNCRRCCEIRDISTVGMQPFGQEDDRALKAMQRIAGRARGCT